MGDQPAGVPDDPGPADAESGASGAAPGGAGAGTSRRQILGRRRRANVAGGRQHSHRVKVTPEEEAQLLVRANEQGVTVPRLMLESALSQRPETITERREVIAELFAARRMVTGIAVNLNQITKAANASGEVAEETVHYIRSARQFVARLDQAVEDLSQ